MTTRISFDVEDTQVSGIVARLAELGIHAVSFREGAAPASAAEAQADLDALLQQEFGGADHFDDAVLNAIEPQAAAQAAVQDESRVLTMALAAGCIGVRRTSPARHHSDAVSALMFLMDVVRELRQAQSPVPDGTALN